MLEEAIIEQLKTVFNKLENNVYIVYENSDHIKQNELVDMLQGIASTSNKIVLEKSQETSSHPKCKIYNSKKKSSITFSGIPGGHEFSSLVLSILNSDLKGKFPDEMLIQRIKQIKGSISLKTFVSLSCENCPEVVQSLNLIAVLKEDFHHEMIDGEFAPELVTELGIQGVPSVVDGNKLIHSGKITLLGLVEKLEKAYGKNENIKNKKDLGLYDIVVIGGGPAGVSSAIYTSRKGLKTALITDRIGGQVQDTKSIENMISINYTEGKDLSNSLDKHMKDYDINILEHRKVESIEDGNTKRLNLNSGETISCKSLVIATGAEWKELGIEGEKEYNGRGVAFCPHCDGPYYKGKDISVIGGGNSGVEAAIDLAGIVNSVTLFEFAPELNADNILITKLKSLENVSVITNAKTTRIIGNGEKVTSMEYEDRSQNKIKSIKLDGVFVQIGLVPNSGFIKGLVDTNKYGEILVSEKNRTNIDKIYAAGDVTNVPYKQIIIAMGEGAKVGLTAFEDLMIA